MAGRGKKKLSREELKNRKWLFGVYTRRSFDDGDDAESNTIINQKHLIEAHLEKLSENIEIVDYYVDDGYTGTNFNRPNFKRLMNDVLSGKINGIIVKDLSRLGRNHLEVGKYIEEIFPLHSIRIIAVNDDVDSFNNPESIRSLNVPIKNLVNEGVSRDLSKKVASAYVSMARNRQFVAGTTPYGYALDPNDKHHLVIDEKEAKIIREIFKMALEGNGRIKICKYLNSQGILCRKEISRRKKANLSLEPFALESRYYWCTTTIGRILTNETYIGNLVQLKTKRKEFGSKKATNVKKEDWIRCENTHEAIISKEDFDKVQEQIKLNEKAHSKPLNMSLFRGIIKCSDCGGAMVKQDDFRGNRNCSNYFCLSYLSRHNNCSPHKIKTDLLENSVLEAIKLQIKLVIELDKSISKLYFKNDKNKLEKEYKENIQIAEIKINALKEKKKEIYKDWKFNRIDKSEFSKLYEECNQNIELLNSNIELYTSTYKETVKMLKKDDYWIDHYKRNKKIKTLTRSVVVDLIEKIIVFNDGKVEVIFKYHDEYEQLLAFLEKEMADNREKMEVWSVSETVS